ncbi:MAG: NAD(P)/FAD-dependent oxidoreductase [Promethearchaeota archaeon]|nr:MAG: NAD(P)/FAD-dependent oxidoreductase [Candidatus Lokiarchaeota archaeon]
MLYDVIIVGAGPAGSLLAKKLADADQKVLLLEHKKLPRHKMCSGLISSFSRRILKQEIGNVPEVLCCHPKIVKGIHVYPTRNTPPQKFREKNYNVWRSDFDFWLTTKASEAGAVVLDQTELTGFTETPESIEVHLRDMNGTQKLQTRVLVGADGGISSIRRTLYKNEKIEWLNVYQTYWRGELGLDPEYFHTFLDPEFSEFFAWANIKSGHKGKYVLFGTAAARGSRIPHYFNIFQEYLEEAHGFKGKQMLFKEACTAPRFFTPTYNYRFGKDRVLLIGEAAGLFNIFAEGISPALTSAVHASDALLSSTDHPVAQYEENIQPLLKSLKLGWESVLQIFPKFTSSD